MQNKEYNFHIRFFFYHILQVRKLGPIFLFQLIHQLNKTINFSKVLIFQFFYMVLQRFDLIIAVIFCKLCLFLVGYGILPFDLKLFSLSQDPLPPFHKDDRLREKNRQDLKKYLGWLIFHEWILHWFVCLIYYRLQRMLTFYPCH